MKSIRPPRRKIGLSLKLLVACVVLTFLCIAGGITVLKLDPAPSWAADAERTFKIGCWMFMLLGVLLKGAIVLFERPE
jgi:hypothetical protein